MENTTHQSIAARREALYGYYDLPPEARAKAENLFARMETLAAESTAAGQSNTAGQSTDTAAFEAALAASPLAAEYNALFTEFAPFVKLPDGGSVGQMVKENTRQNALEGVQSAARHQVEQEVRSAIYGAMPDELRRWKFGGAIYSVPILGDILGAMNRWHSVKRLFGKTKN
jgi:hypothetical protein